MSTNLAFVLSLIWVILLLGATVLNYLKGRSPLFYSSVFLLAIYATTHLININWLATLPAIEAVKVHYLFYSAVQAVIGIGLFWLNRKNMTLTMGLAIFLLGLETILNFAVHVDRNVMALNFNAVPNLASSSQWFLWHIKDVIATLNNPVLIVAVVLHKVYKFEPADTNEAIDIGEDVERFVKGWKDSTLKVELLNMLNKGIAELLEHNLKREKTRNLIGLTLIEKAIAISYYEPDRSNCGRFARFMYWLRS
ncbi:hypothetical protein KIH87_04375 [Paraneptunicella aestuarii]|uniref:hypothetical protein n=1 Tax=Paraneptunicella aestuarii TaxID=2831148 RepID=UPI001E309F0F|nr:hypothetical protein [Paraneptunicella aestuarii]UAA39601.1 hypothetical protein KIH87_04375 [Paraneptunicella aestuarii]